MNLIDHLPRHSFKFEAIVKDKRLAEMFANSNGESEERHSEWTADHEVLVFISDQLQYIAQILIKANDGKPGPFKPWKRPENAVTAVRERNRRQRHHEFSERMTQRPA